MNRIENDCLQAIAAMRLHCDCDKCPRMSKHSKFKMNESKIKIQTTIKAIDKRILFISYAIRFVISKVKKKKDEKGKRENSKPTFMANMMDVHSHWVHRTEKCKFYWLQTVEHNASFICHGLCFITSLSGNWSYCLTWQIYVNETNFWLNFIRSITFCILIDDRYSALVSHYSCLFFISGILVLLWIWSASIPCDVLKKNFSSNNCPFWFRRCFLFLSRFIRLFNEQLIAIYYLDLADLQIISEAYF